MIDPKPLFPGARVALVAPASAVPEEKLPGALDLVRRLGMEPVLYPSCYFANRDGYLAATDAQRAEDVNRAFADKTIDGVFRLNIEHISGKRLVKAGEPGMGYKKG